MTFWMPRKKSCSDKGKRNFSSRSSEQQIVVRSSVIVPLLSSACRKFIREILRVSENIHQKESASKCVEIRVNVLNPGQVSQRNYDRQSCSC